MGNVARSAHELSPNALAASGSNPPPHSARLLTPSRAWEILHHRLGIRVARSTFYRWLESGKVLSVKLGNRLYVPASEVQMVIRKCVSGEGL